MDTPSLIITGAMLRHYNLCDRRTWLERYGPGAAREEIIFISPGEQAAAKPVLARSWTEGVQATRQLMANHTPVILGGCLEAPVDIEGVDQPVLFRSKADRLELARDTSRSGEDPRYVVAESGPDSDPLHMDALRWLLARIQSHSADTTPGNAFNEARLFEALHDIAGILGDPSSAPPVILESHCLNCRWYSACRQVHARNVLDLGLLAGLSTRARANLREAGIASLNEIAAMQPEALQQFKGIKTTAYSIHAGARAWVEKKPIWYGGLPAVARSSGWVFDIETVPYTDDVWSIGWSDRPGHAKIVLVCPTPTPQQRTLPDGLDAVIVETSEDAWQYFCDSVAGSECPIYHWTNFDAGVMKKRAPRGVWDGLNPRLHDLHHTFNKTVRIPIRNSSLKTVAAYLDFAYSAYAAWDLAYRDYTVWRQRGDAEAIQRACAYQGDDVKATVLVWQWLAENAPD